MQSLSVSPLSSPKFSNSYEWDKTQPCLITNSFYACNQGTTFEGNEKYSFKKSRPHLKGKVETYSSSLMYLAQLTSLKAGINSGYQKNNFFHSYRNTSYWQNKLWLLFSIVHHEVRSCMKSLMNKFIIPTMVI